MKKKPKPLEYAAAPNVRRRWIWRALGGGMMVLLLAGLLWWYDDVLLHIRLFYWQRQCMNYALEPGRVVFETDAASADRLLKESSAYVPGGGNWIGAAYRPAEPWARMYALLSPPGQRTMPAAFVHSRQSPDGKRWLVAVHLYTDVPASKESFLYVDVVRPGRGLDRPRLWRSTLDRALVVDPVRIYAGQVDPEDRTHFTIEYDDRDGRRRILDGWVKDGGRVTIERRRTEE